MRGARTSRCSPVTGQVSVGKHYQNSVQKTEQKKPALDEMCQKACGQKKTVCLIDFYEKKPLCDKAGERNSEQTREKSSHSLGVAATKTSVLRWRAGHTKSGTTAFLFVFTETKQSNTLVNMRM